jgi:hypothetical protein
MNFDDLTLVLRNVASGLILLYAAGSAAARIGLVPSRILRWWDKRWRERIEREERDEVLDAIAAEFKPNHGTSLRDQIDCIKSTVDEHTVTLASHIAAADRQDAILAAHLADHERR